MELIVEDGSSGSKSVPTPSCLPAGIVSNYHQSWRGVLAVLSTFLLTFRPTCCPDYLFAAFLPRLSFNQVQSIQPSQSMVESRWLIARPELLTIRTPISNYTSKLPSVSSKLIRALIL